MGKIYDRFKNKAANLRTQASNKSSRGMTLSEMLASPFGGDIGHKISDEYLAKHGHKKKGHFNGLCNRSACLSPHSVTWYNCGSYAFYCQKCALMLNRVNQHDSWLNGEPLCREVTEEEANKLHVSP